MDCKYKQNNCVVHYCGVFYKKLSKVNSTVFLKNNCWRPFCGETGIAVFYFWSHLPEVSKSGWIPWLACDGFLRFTSDVIPANLSFFLLTFSSIGSWIHVLVCARQALLPTKLLNEDRLIYWPPNLKLCRWTTEDLTNPELSPQSVTTYFTTKMKHFFIKLQSNFSGIRGSFTYVVFF